MVSQFSVSLEVKIELVVEFLVKRRSSLKDEQYSGQNDIFLVRGRCGPCLSKMQLEQWLHLVPRTAASRAIYTVSRSDRRQSLPLLVLVYMTNQNRAASDVYLRTEALSCLRGQILLKTYLENSDSFFPRN